MSDLLDALILCFVVFSAIRFLSRFASRIGQARSGTGSAANAGRPAAAAPETTVLHRDPVCGTYVAPDTSLKRIVGGRVLHFCSAECQARYQG
jgi:YHS domain-containing protein